MELLAYIDPLSGSIILQAVAAVALAAGYHFGQIRTRVSNFFRSLRRRAKPE